MRKRLLLILTVFMLFNTVLGSAAVAAENDKNTIYLFDLKPFLSTFEKSKVAYDYLKLATALQGLVNRERPQIYFFFESNYMAKEAGMDMDRFWFDQLKEKGNYLSEFNIVNETDFFALVNHFEDKIKGIVLWDENVPASANVASTIAGVENLLPVRFDETPGSLYDEIVVKRNLFPVKVDLVDKFTGEGVIPDIGVKSTGSAKNDAYIWAKIKYLDKGLTNPTLMMYALDAITWQKKDNEYDAKMYSAYIPERIEAGQEADVSITIKNTGKTTWTLASNDRLGATSENQFIWEKRNGGYSTGPTNQRIFLDREDKIQPGDMKTFRFALVAPETPGTYVFSARMVRDGKTWMGETLTRTIEVTDTEVEDKEIIEVPIESEYDEFVYLDLYNSYLLNADYYIANKAFFFDLSPDKERVPNDDPDQPLGTDYNTLIKLLRSQNQKAGKNIITIGGFVPWWLKYSNAADPKATTDSEWMFVDIASKYNAQLDADAFALIGMTNASVFQYIPMPKKFVQKNDKGKNGKSYDKSVKYISFYMGDYDSAAWTSGVLPVMWNDPKRGEIPLAWPFSPQVSRRAPHAMNYIYNSMMPNDYFVAGDNGAGYLNPMMLLKENRPDGLPEFLNVWEKYNKKYYKQFDLDISGFVISSFSGMIPKKVQEMYRRFSPVGVGTNAGFELPFVNGTPFFTLRDLRGPGFSDHKALGEDIANMLRQNQQFMNFRVVLIKPTTIVDAVNYVKEKYPELSFEVVDPYTFYRFYTESGGSLGENIRTYECINVETPICIDGKIESDEWDNAEEIIISIESEDVNRHGTVWGTMHGEADLQSKYRLKWDKQYLYLLEERQDDLLWFTHSDSELYKSDATMLFLDLDHDKRGSMYRDGDYAIMVTANSPDGTPKIILREGHDSGMRERQFTEATVEATINSNGYVMEVAIPWSVLKVIPFTPKNDLKVGMTLLATDNDGPEKWGQIMWVGNGDGQENWADMIFKDAN